MQRGARGKEKAEGEKVKGRGENQESPERMCDEIGSELAL